MYFAQITDTHITTKDPSPFPGRSPKAQLKKIISYLEGMPSKLDAVIITGDCVHEGSVEEYQILWKVLSDFKMPYYLIPGNHDNRENFRQIFTNFSSLCPGTYLQYVIENFPVRLIGLDTLCDNEVYGVLDNERLNWLDDILAQEQEKPTILFMHHPPIQVGMLPMDKYALRDNKKLSDVLKRHPQVKHILCGHFHRHIQTMWSGIPVTVAGSTIMQFKPEVRPDVKLEWSTEPSALALHWWNGKNLITQFCSLPDTD